MVVLMLRTVIMGWEGAPLSPEFLLLFTLLYYYVVLGTSTSATLGSTLVKK